MTVASNVFITHAGTGVMLYRILCVEHTKKYLHILSAWTTSLYQGLGCLQQCSTGLGTCVTDLWHKSSN